MWHPHSAISVSLISGITETCLLLLCLLTICTTAEPLFFSDAKRKCIRFWCKQIISDISPHMILLLSSYYMEKSVNKRQIPQGITHWTTVFRQCQTVLTQSLLFPVGSMKEHLMKVWLEQSCSSRSRRRRWSGSRPTWPAGCPGPICTPPMTPWSHLALPCSTFETPCTPLLQHFVNPRFLLCLA